MRQRAWAWIGVFGVLLGVSVSADTLVMRDGQRLRGQLVAVRDGVVDFEVQRGFFQREACGRPMPNRPAAALIGRVGESNEYFFIGDDTGAVRVRDSGRLYLGINDDFLQDNSGAFRVTVYY